jgi:hypothetical protein
LEEFGYLAGIALTEFVDPGSELASAIASQMQASEEGKQGAAVVREMRTDPHCRF